VDVEPTELIEKYPRLFHMASAAAWPSIQERGLLTTEQLVDQYGVTGPRRESILTRVRPTNVVLRRDPLPEVVIRDQKPMKFLDEKIEDGSTTELFLAAINARVFFWPSFERLSRLLGAQEYRHRPQVILHIDTARLLERHGGRVELCRFNSGAITQKNHPARGHRSWMPIVDYPYQEYRRRHGAARALAEVTVRGGVPDVLDVVDHVDWTASVAR
jgi:hypothetical protein